MRKILFLFAALIMSVCSAMADNITSLEQVQEDALYTLSCGRGYITVKNDYTKLYGSNQNPKTDAAANNFDAENEAFQFKFVKEGDNYYLYNVLANKYSKNDGTLVDDIADAAAISFRDWGNGTAQPYWDASHNLNLGGSNEVAITGWDRQDAGDTFTITKLEILDYTVTVEGLTGQGGVSYKGTEYADGATFKAAVANVALFTPVAVDGYGVALSVNGNTVTVTYTEVPTWKNYEEWDVAGKGADVVKSAATGYYAILGWDQQNIKDMYLYDNGASVKGKVWANQPEFVWFAEKQSNGKYTFRNFKTGKYITITSSNGAALNMSENATELNFVFSGETAAIHNGSHGIDVGWRGDGPTAWSGTAPDGSRRLMIYPVEFVPAAVKANVTYDYYFDGSKVASETLRVNAGDEYPEPTMSFGGYTLSSKPEGTATADCTEQIQLTWNGPIEFTTVADGEFAPTTKWYFIENFTNGYVAYDNDEAAQSSITTAGTTDAYKWCFVRIPSTINFYLYNKQAGAATPLREQLSADSGYASNHNQGYCVIKEEGTNDMPLYFFVNGDSYGIRLAGVDGKCNLGKHVGSKLSIWGKQATDGDNGSRFTFTEVTTRDFTVSITGAPDGTQVTYKDVKYGDGDVITAEAVAPAEIVADEIAGYTAIVTVNGEDITVAYAVKAISQLSELVQGQVYTITSGGTRGAFVYTENGLSSTTKEGIAADETSENQQFLFVQKDGAYYLYSVGAHAFINVTGQDANNNRAVACGAKPVNTTLEFVANQHSSKATHPVVLSIDGHHVGVSNGFQPAVITHYQSTNDEGNSLRILPVAGTTVDVTDILAAMDATDWDAYMALYNTLDAYTVGTAYGQYADISTEDGESTLEYQKFMYQLDYNMKVEERYESNMEEMQWFLDHMQINLPKKGAVIRIKASNKHISTPTYLSGNNRTDGARAAFEVEPEDDNKDVVWMYDGQYLTCYGTGLTAANNQKFMNIQMYPNTTRIEFQAAANGTVGMYNIKFAGSRYLFTNAGNYTDAGNGASGEGYNFEIEDAARYFAIDYGTAGWASLYLPVDVTLAPKYGIEAAYLIKEGENGYLKAEEIFNLPGFTPAIVKVNTEYTGNPFGKGCAFEGNSIETALQGALWKQDTPADTYVLNLNEAGNPVFRHYTGATLGHCKAYYQKPAGSSESVLRINFGEENPTAIMDAIMEAEFSGDVYDLTGRRINGVQNGVFIKNGRKVIK